MDRRRLLFVVAARILSRRFGTITTVPAFPAPRETAAPFGKESRHPWC
jgi:hypothetical protein